MKVVAFNGSPRNNGNTENIIKMMFEVLNKEGIKTELINIGKKRLSGCVSCGMCYKNKDERCSLNDDEIVNESIQKIKEADGVIFGSPVYYSAMNGTLSCFMDRIFYVSRANKDLFKHKVATGVCAVRRSGASTTLDQIHKYFSISEMFVPTSSYWNANYSCQLEEYKDDIEGVKTMDKLAKNMAYLLKIINATKNTIKKPE